MLTLENFFNSEITLENERAKLTPLKKEDQVVLEGIAYEPQIWQWGMSDLKNSSDLAAYIDAALSEKQNRISYPFLIFDKKLNSTAGSTRFGSISIPNKRVEIGWTWYKPSLQRTGINKACKFLLLTFGFEALDLNRIELKTSSLNLKSQGAMLKIGAVKEGILRRHSINDSGKVRDTVYFSFIKEEWLEIKQRIFSEFCSK